MTAQSEDRVFNPNGRKHFRRTYSLTEVRYSLLALVVLATIGGWVGWRGAHPDPELLALESNLLAAGSADAPERARRLGVGSGDGAGAGAAEPAAAAGDRGPVPPGLAAPGWHERSVAAFSRDNMYEKINGRAGYYESYGVVALHYVTLVHGEDEAVTVDIEMYDMGKLANALGAYAGERQPGSAPELVGGTLGHTARNAMFLVRGRFYVRAIGADEGEAVQAQLAHLRSALAAGIESEPLPWAHGLFLAAGADPAKVGFLPQNAFSFGFARNVYTVGVTDDGAELFVVATTDEAAAKALAAQFAEGFLSYGKDAGRKDGIAWIEDQYLATLAGATTRGALVLGIRGAPDRAFAEKALAGLLSAAEALPESVRAQATAEASRPPGQAEGGPQEPNAEPNAEPGAEPNDEPGAEPGAAPGGEYEADPGATPGSAYEDEYGADPGAGAPGAAPSDPEENAP